VITIRDFLAAFFPDEDEKIYLRAFKAKGAPDTPENRPRVEVITRRELAKDVALQNRLAATNKTRGMYFVVNAGGNMDEDIKHLNAFFIENDRLSISEQHKQLDAAPLPPSIRLETWKSVHAHWLLKGDCNPAAWREIQERLIAYFDGDINIKNPSRVMRLPFFNYVYYNAQTGAHEYKRVELHTFEPDRRFTLAEMQLAFPKITPAEGIVMLSEASSPDIGKFVPNIADVIGNGSRHKELLSLAGTMRRRGLGAEEIFAALKVTNQLRCQPPLDEAEVLELCQDIARRYAPETLSVSTNGSNRAGKPTGAKEFVFTSLNQLLAEPEEEVSFVWEKTLPVGGFSICSAKPKVGKSTLARNLALSMTRGEPFLGRETVKGKVLYLCLEEKRAEIAKHFRRMGTSDSDDVQVAFATPGNALTALEIAIAEHEPALTIIDPLSRLLRVRDFNDYGSVSRSLEPFIDIARKMACHILALHHDGKGERDGGDALLGSTALFGAVDCHIQMKKRERGRTIQTTQRYGEDLPETVVELDAETGLIRAQGDLQAVLQADKKTEILSAMSDTEELTEADLKERVGGKQGLISLAIRALVEEGKLSRNGIGRKGNPYTYRKNLANPADLENLTNLVSDNSQEDRFSRSMDIDKPRNLEISEAEASDLSGDKLFDASPLPEYTDQSPDRLPQSYSYPCWTCSATVSSEDTHCPNCDQNLSDLPF
jgi:RecA-family ATPase